MPRVLILPGMRAGKKKSHETELAKAIRDALAANRYWAIRVNSGAIHRGDMHMTLAPIGTPDICVVSPYGWIEVKDQARVTAAQRAWHEKARARGVRVAVAHSVEEAIATVRGWEKEDSKGAE